jgi:hypothetical protein
MKTSEKEPIVQRIIEVPEDLEQFVNRDTRARFIAYAPAGWLSAGARARPCRAHPVTAPI